MTLNQQLSSRVLAIKCNDNLLMKQSATKSIEIYQFPNTGISIVIKRVLSSLSRLQRYRSKQNVRLIENNMNKFITYFLTLQILHFSLPSSPDAH